MELEGLSILKGIGGVITAAGGMVGAPILAHNKGYEKGLVQKNISKQEKIKEEEKIEETEVIAPEEKIEESDDKDEDPKTPENIPTEPKTESLKNISLSSIEERIKPGSETYVTTTYSDKKMSEFAKASLLASWCSNDREGCMKKYYLGGGEEARKLSSMTSTVKNKDFLSWYLSKNESKELTE